MHFMRYQEFYEGVNEDFRGKNFELLDFIKWYSEDKNGPFTYLDDWAGFNVPGECFDNLYEQGIPDPNRYDKFMRMVYDMIRHLVGSEKFYLIGCTMGDEESMNHEIAHGMWYLEDHYRKAQQGNIYWLAKQRSEFYRSLKSALIADGYTPKVIDDEIQAYLSTGTDAAIDECFKTTKTAKKSVLDRFANTFGKFRNG